LISVQRVTAGIRSQSGWQKGSSCGMTIRRNSSKRESEKL